MPGLKRGYVQVYTGNGKGKTTAALGLALRAAGAGLRVFIIQLMKEYPYSELESLKALAERITIEQSGDDAFVYRNELPSEAQKAELVLTGRYCPEAILERADLVSEMREVKHYYENGVLARKGIES
ncbi:MAG: cob(I)yrinic acid a,c-diamide adenosyltransferase [Gemmatimonadota bacterium]